MIYSYFLEITCIEDSDSLQSDLNYLAEWSEANRLSLNKQKCYTLESQQMLGIAMI